MSDKYDPWENTIHIGQLFNGYVWCNHAAKTRDDILRVLEGELKLHLEPLFRWVQDPSNQIPVELEAVRGNPRDLLLYLEALTKKWQDDEDSLAQDEWDVLEYARLEIIEAPFHKEVT